MTKKKKFRWVHGIKICLKALATESRKNSVSNNTIKKSAISTAEAEFEWPKDLVRKQPKPLKHAKKRKKQGKVIVTKSEFPLSKTNKMTHSEYNERLIEYKMAKWEKKHPKPVKENDLFESQFLPQWMNERKLAEERIVNFVNSIHDKLSLTGRYKETENQFTEKEITKLKDKKGEGNEINQLNPRKSDLLKKAQKEVNKEKKNNDSLVVGHIMDHKKEKGRLILPKAA